VPRSEQVVDDLVDAILDGTPIDWAAAESSCEGAAPPLLRQLKVLAALAELHRGVPLSILTLSQVAPSRVGPEVREAPVLWGHLRLVERIGRGAFGEVYRAWDTRLDREVALKLLPGGRSPTDRAASSIIHEGRLLAKVRHPNVVTIHGAEQIGDQIGLWMEFVRGRTLEQIVDQRKVVSAAEAVDIGLELCGAVSAVHGAGLLHRDIKAHNVMRAEDGRIVLMDFGTGKELDEDASSDLAGTPLYLAPEVLQGQQATIQSDIYSLGVLFHHLVTGSYPVHALTMRGVRRAHERGERTAVRTARRAVPRKLARVIERAIDPDPERRYQNANALGADLAALKPRSTVVRLAYATGVAAALMLVVAVGWEAWGRQVGSSRTPSVLLAGVVGVNPIGATNLSALGQPVIAVLPLKNLSAEPESDYFVDGLTDEIIRNLAVIQGLQVRSRTSSFAFKDKPRNVREVGQQLGANLVVEGSVLRAGNKLRVNAQLVQVAGDVPLWSERFEKELKDIFAIQDEISRAIVNKLRLTLGRGQRRYDTDIDTYGLYLKARGMVGKVPESLTIAAVELFQQVIARDPGFAPAYAGLVDAYAYISNHIRSQPSSSTPMLEDALPLMRQAAMKALELDELLAEGHAAMGTVYARELDWNNAQKSFRRALELNPNLTRIHREYAVSTLVPLGRLDEAQQLLEQALAVDPLSADVLSGLGYVKMNTGDYEEAVDYLRRSLSLDPTVIYTDDTLARSLTFAGRVSEAMPIWDRKKGPGWEYWKSFAYVMSGRRAEVERMADSNDHPLRLAVIYAALGDKDRTFALLDQAVETVPHRVSWILANPEMALLRGDPRLPALRKKLNLP
jgi:eukaryotic-like serine/threonine-protein kinase